MNEIELLRNQLATERRHVRAVASACAAAHLAGGAMQGGTALEALRRACTEYLGCMLDWFDQRDERLDALYPHISAGDEGRRARAVDLSGRGREALDRLEQGGPAHETWQAVARFINGAWDARRGAIEAALGANTRVADWRAFARVDADSVCQERALYARVRAALPEGVELA